MTSVCQEQCTPVCKDVIPSLIPSALTHREATDSAKELLWNFLDAVTVGEAVGHWLATLSRLTAINYRSGMRKLSEGGYIALKLSLQGFSLMNHEAVIDSIKARPEWAEGTRQARAACYISFTGFLSRRFQGVIKKAVTSKEGTSKTFYRIHEKVRSNAMNQAQWMAFLGAISNKRDCLIAKIALQGGKRINEVLGLTTEQIAWDRNEIAFVQSKTRGTRRETVITYPPSVINQLREYIGSREGIVFLTRNLKPVPLIQVANSFRRAGIKANIPFMVTPHVLRASTVTFLKQQGFSDSDIMKVTGHASAEMVFAYDKSARADNASKRVCLV